MNRRIAALVISATAVLGLTACTGGSPVPGSPAAQTAGSSDQAGDGGQSVADACSLVQQTITDATAEFGDSSSSDPAAVVAAMKAAAGKVADVSGKITNDQVAALLPNLRDMFSQMADTVEAVAGGDVSKAGDLTDLGAKFQETGDTFQKLCSTP